MIVARCVCVVRCGGVVVLAVEVGRYWVVVKVVVVLVAQVAQLEVVLAPKPLVPWGMGPLWRQCLRSLAGAAVHQVVALARQRDAPGNSWRRP